MMSFVKFIGVAWLKTAIELLKMTIADALDLLGHLIYLDKAPKTALRRISSLYSFYQYLATAVAETCLSVVAPNPAQA